MKFLFTILAVAALLSTGCTSVARWYTTHVAHTTDLEQGPPDPSLFSPLPSPGSQPDPWPGTNRPGAAVGNSEGPFGVRTPGDIFISTAPLYDPSFSNSWSSIQRSDDLVHWRTIASNYFGLPDPTYSWNLDVDGGGQAGFFRAMKQGGYLQ